MNSVALNVIFPCNSFTLFFFHVIRIFSTRFTYVNYNFFLPVICLLAIHLTLNHDSFVFHAIHFSGFRFPHAIVSFSRPDFFSYMLFTWRRSCVNSVLKHCFLYIFTWFEFAACDLPKCDFSPHMTLLFACNLFACNCLPVILYPWFMTHSFLHVRFFFPQCGLFLFLDVNHFFTWLTDSHWFNPRFFYFLDVI